MEGPAPWREDGVSDAVDDNRLYLGFSPLSSPARSLDSGRGLFVYGTWIWWRYLSEQLPDDGGTGSGVPVVIRRIWEAADDSEAAKPGGYSLQAVRRVLAESGADLTDVFADFAD